MPIYEFSCQNCGTEFETMRSFSDSTEPVCPSCASASVQRRLSRPAIHFKGSGWYINDSKNNGKATSTGGSKDGEGDADATKLSEAKADGEKSTETKPDTKSDDAKSSDPKSSDAKSTETKATETKASEAKTKPAEAKAEKS